MGLKLIQSNITEDSRAERDLPSELDIIVDIRNSKIVHIEEDMIIIRRSFDKSFQKNIKGMVRYTRQELLTSMAYSFRDSEEFQQCLANLRDNKQIKIYIPAQTGIFDNQN